jgi:hypothetical protein
MKKSTHSPLPGGEVASGSERVRGCAHHAKAIADIAHMQTLPLTPTLSRWERG